MRHPRRAPRPRSAAAVAPILFVSLLLPAAAVAADRETPRAVSRERGSSARSSAPARPSTPSQPSQPVARGPERTPSGGSGGSSAARVPDDRRGDRRDRAESRYRWGSGSRHYYYPGPYYGGWYGSGWYGGFWTSLLFDFYGPWAYHAPYGYGYGYGHRGYRSGRDWDGEDWGALDLDVSPAKTEVFLDGQYLGRVDAFDGFPQYLWLEEGTYDLVLYKDGYKTIARQITVLPGVVIEVDHNLEPGESVRPDDLASTSHERRDRRLRYERQARERVREMEGEDEDEAEIDDGDEADAEIAEVEAEAEADDDAGDTRLERRRQGDRGEVGRVRLEVEPDDASVYLDGRFLGTGAEIGRLHSGLILDRGAHKISVVRPGYRARELSFDVKAGEELELEVSLEPGS
jgi:hypothetical protein